ncbi:RNA polymerase sigma factor [Sungkyunkwania multivorans]|uniref:RNA polymerase sigma factor n=1 Tax=Sungkyunkwania multivorans TaxID=1173618 RepID=A0ABW3CUB9_9FLAO
MTEEQLIKQLVEKDPKAFDILYQKYSESLQGVIYAIVKDVEIAEEVLQDTFIKVWNNATSYSSAKGRLFTWMLNIARNGAIDILRSKSFGNQKKNLTADYFVDILASNDRVDAMIDLKGIINYVETLKEKCKKIIDLLYFKGFTQKEVAETLEIPIGTVKTRNRSCLSKLREKLPASYGH